MKPYALKTLKTILVVTLAVMVSGAPVTVAEAAKGGRATTANKVLVAAIRDAKSELVRPAAKLRNLIVRAQTEGPDLKAIRQTTRESLKGLKAFREGIRKASNALKESDKITAQAILDSVVAFYGFKTTVMLSYESFGAGSGVSRDDVADLDLIVSKRAAKFLLDFYSQAAEGSGGQLYDLPYSVHDAGNGEKRLVLNAREAAQFRLGSFIAFPEEKTAEHMFRFYALKLVLARQALYNTYLYSDEQVHAPLPSNADPLLIAMQSQANSIAKESMFREYLAAGSNLLKGFSKSVGENRPSFEAESKETFKMIAKAISSQIDTNKLARFGGSPEGLAEKFVQFEEMQRFNAIQSAIKRVPVHLTQLDREALRETLIDVVRVAVVNVAMVALDIGLLKSRIVSDPEDPKGTTYLSDEERAKLFVLLNAFTEKVIDENVINDAVLAEFEKVRGDHDTMVSVRRYALASKVQLGLDALDGMQEKLTRIEKRKEVPDDYIEKSPEPGVVLLALKPMEPDTAYDGMPVWLFETIQYLGSLAAKTKDQSKRSRLEMVLRAFPEELMELAREAKENATDYVAEEILREHRELLQNNQYRWNSLDTRIKRLERGVTSEAAETVVNRFAKMASLAGKVQATALSDLVHRAFNILIDRDFQDQKLALEMSNTKTGTAGIYADKGVDKVMEVYENRRAGLDQLMREVQKAREYLAYNYEFVHSLFGDPKERDRMLRDKLRDKSIFQNYLSVYVQHLQSTMPYLFHGLKLPSNVRKSVNNSEPVQFSDLMLGMRRAADTMFAEHSLGKAALLGLKKEHLKDPSKLGDEIASGLEPDVLLISAAGVSKDSTKWWQDIIHWRLEKNAKKTGSAQPTADHHWPSNFKVRDVLPAYFDTAPLKLKTERMYLSSFLSPFLISAALATKREQADLLDSKKSHLDVLVKSEAYRMLMGDAGAELGEGLNELQMRANKWKRWLQMVKKATMKTQHVAHYAFNATFFLEVDQKAHLVGGWYMFLSSIVDFAADIGMFIDYWNSYADMRRFSYGGFIGQSTFAYHELQSIRAEMNNTMEVIVSRGLMDLAFYQSMGRSMLIGMRHLKQSRAMKRKLEKAGLSEQDYKADLMKLTEAHQSVGLPPGVGPEQFAEFYKVIKEDMGPHAAKDAAMRREFEKWTKANEANEQFLTKWAPVFGNGKDTASVDASTKKKDKTKRKANKKRKKRRGY